MGTYITMRNVLKVANFRNLEIFGGARRWESCGPPPLCSTSTIDTPTGMKMPAIGLGTWQANQESVLDPAIRCALAYGYRHFDTAYDYNNEEILGNIFCKVFKEGTFCREDIFITTKLPYYGMTASGVEKYVCKSMENLKTSYIDLYMIHFPAGCIMDASGKTKPDPNTDITAVWKAMECLVKQCRVKFIGVSNFNKCQLEKLLSCAEIKPSCFQMELHPYFQQAELRRMACDQCIAVTAAAPLGSPPLYNFLMSKCAQARKLKLFDEAVIRQVSRRVCKSPAQIVLRFLLELGNVSIIPASTSPAHIYENIDLFNFGICDSELQRLLCLDMDDGGRQFNKIAFSYLMPGVEQHPMFPFK